MSYPQQPERHPGGRSGAHGPGGYPDFGGGQPPPYPYPSYPPRLDLPLRPPSAATAVIAGILAILGAVWAAYSGIDDFRAAPSADAPVAWVVWMQAVVFMVELCTLLPGAILVFVRKPTGGWLVALGAALHIVQGIVALVGFTGALGSTGPVAPGQVLGFGVAGLLVVLAPALATLILALLPATRSWLGWGRSRAPQVPYPYPPPGL